MIAASAMVALSSCGEQKQVTSPLRVLTATVAVQDETLLRVDSFVPVEVSGDPALREIRVRLEATATASTSSRAARLARMISLKVERTLADGVRAVQVSVSEVPMTTLSGVLKVSLPPSLRVDVIQGAGTAIVRSINGAIRVAAGAPVLVENAGGEVRVGIRGAGNAVVDTRLFGIATVDVDVQAGDIELRVPAALSADIIATPDRSGQVILSHPGLPMFFGMAGDTYRASVGGGLSSIRLKTGRGRIIIRQRM